MDVSEVASLAAVAISLVALISQGVSAFRRRRTLGVKLYLGKTSNSDNGITVEQDYLMVVANARGGAVGVGVVIFELEPKPDSLSWSGMEEDWAGKMGAGFDPMATHAAIQDGDTAAWHFRLNIVGDAPTYEAKVIVVLSNGKKIRTMPVTVSKQGMDSCIVPTLV